MGINGLWPLIEETGTNITLDAFEGKRLAIDVSIWIYQAQNGPNSFKSNSKSLYITLLVNRIAKLLYYKVRPVFVFDGEEIPIFKKKVLRDRGLSRQLEEMTWSKAQKRAFEQLAMKHFKDNKAYSTVQNKPLHGPFIECSQAVIPSPSNCDRISLNWSDESSISDCETELLEECGSIDKKIALVESVRDHQKNSRLQPEEIPSNSKQFSKFQLGRLIERNELNAKLEKLKKDKIWQNIHRPSDDGQTKIIVADKQQRVHVFNRTSELQLCEDESMNSANFDWLHFVKAQNECDSHRKTTKGNANFSAPDSHSTDDDDFINVYDFEVGGINEVPELTTDAPVQPFLDYFESCDVTPGEQTMEKDEETHFETQTVQQNIACKDNEEDIYADCYMLLTFLGIPFMKAPAEAEAQCVELERLGLVDGIVTDDSDVWLFGGRRVYRHMFSRKKHLQKYCSDEICQKLGLRRAEFVQLGMLAGGDYSRGLEKVGIVTALELISEFVGQTASVEDEFERALSSLKCISKWLLSQENGLSAADSTRRVRLRRAVEANNTKETIESFPSVEVFEMYVKPRVDSLEKGFCWNRIDFGKLEHFLQRKLGLSVQSLNKKTFGAFEKWNVFIEQNNRSYQLRITEFVKANDAFGGILGATQTLKQRERVQQAFGNIKNSNNAAVRNEDPKCRRKLKRCRRKTSENYNGKNGKKTSEFAKELNLSEESSDE